MTGHRTAFRHSLFLKVVALLLLSLVQLGHGAAEGVKTIPRLTHGDIGRQTGNLRGRSQTPRDYGLLASGSEKLHSPPKVRSQTARDTGSGAYGTLPSGIQRPPQLPYVYNDTVESIAQQAINYAKAFNTTIEGILDTVKSPQEATFENTILPYLLTQNEQLAAIWPTYQYSLGLKPELSDAVDYTDGNNTAIDNAILTNEAYFKLVDYLYQSNVNSTTLDEEDHIILVKTWRDFVKTGVNFPAGEKRDHYQNITARLDDITQEFIANYKADTQILNFTAEELEGVPASTLSTFPNATEPGKLEVNVAVRTNFVAIMNNAVNETTRYLTQVAYDNQAPENAALVEESMQLRLEVAQLFGYPSWADYALTENLAGTSEVVTDFIAEIYNHVEPLAQSNLQQLGKLKLNDSNIVSPIGENDIAYSWDLMFYKNVQDKMSSLDVEAIEEYLPVNTTIPAILEFYGEIYGIYFDRIQGQDADELSPTGNGSDLLWHPDVYMYAVWDIDEYREKYGVSDDGFVGYLYLDLFYREGVKAPAGPYASPITPGFIKRDGCWNHPSSAAIYVLTKSEQEDRKPSFIDFENLEDVLHELGHNMHNLLSRVRYAKNHGMNGTPTDHFEFPSQFMQNWAHVAETYRKITRHWSSFSAEAAAEWRKEQNSTDTPLPPATMPESLISAIVDTVNPSAGLFVTEQLAFASYDQAIYNITSLDVVKATDPSELMMRIYRQVGAVPDQSDLGLGYTWGHFETIFTHIVKRYAARYYSYEWCLIYAEDVFYSFFVQDPFNSDVGMRYRTQVLQPGGAKDPLQSLKDFLGRDPSYDGFYQSLKLPTS